MNRNFLKEAIADAKTVKESAIANAKIALEEAFQPQLKSMLAAKLEEMDDDSMDEAEDEVYEAKKDDAEITEKKEYMTKKERKEGDDRKSDNKAEAETEKMRKLKEDDSDLNEILAELDKELREDARTDAEEEGYLDGEEDESEDIGDEDEDIDLEDMSEEDLKKFIEDVIEDMVGAGELEAGESFEDDVDVDVDEEGEIEVEDDMETAVDIELDEKQGYDARLDDAEGAKHGKKKQDMKQRRADSENMEKADGKRKYAGDSKMKEELNEAYATVKTLRSELNEINLLNAKLLYTNKIFKSKNLTESQKVRVLESFDKAGTVKEAKLIFETVTVGFKSKPARNINENLGRASRSMSAPSITKRPIVESDEMVMRFQKLAGIIKS
tara:strand:- start:76 stop:1227 length:1152 start_codon:yes stop_codon:yes gene_type:complete